MFKNVEESVRPLCCITTDAFIFLSLLLLPLIGDFKDQSVWEEPKDLVVPTVDEDIDVCSSRPFLALPTPFRLTGFLLLLFPFVADFVDTFPFPFPFVFAPVVLLLRSRFAVDVVDLADTRLKSLSGSDDAADVGPAAASASPLS